MSQFIDLLDYELLGASKNVGWVDLFLNLERKTFKERATLLCDCQSRVEMVFAFIFVPVSVHVIAFV